MLPSTVKVGGVNYTVEEQENLIQKNDLWGEVNYFNAEINIDSSLSSDRKEQVLIHEVVHAIFLEAGYKEQDEDMINRVGIVLHQVLKDNPNLLHPLANVTHVNIDTSEISEEERERIIKTAKLIMSGQ